MAGATQKKQKISFVKFDFRKKSKIFCMKKAVPGPETAFTSERILEELTNGSTGVYGFVVDFLSLIDRDKLRPAYPARLDWYRPTFVCVPPYAGILP